MSDSSRLRAKTIRLASSFPKGSQERRALLKLLAKRFKLDRKVSDALEKYVTGWYKKQKDDGAMIPTSWASIPKNVQKQLWKPGSGVDLFDLQSAVEDRLWELKYKHSK